jgi:hypothetical protein
LRQRDVIARVYVSPREVEQCMAKRKASPGVDNEFNLAHILVAIPNTADEKQVAERTARAQAVYDRARRGIALDMGVEKGGADALGRHQAQRLRLGRRLDRAVRAPGARLLDRAAAARAQPHRETGSNQGFVPHAALPSRPDPLRP